MIKPDRLIDNTTLNNIFGRGSNYNAQFGTSILNMLANKYNIVITDVIKVEIINNPNYGGDNGILDAWLKSNSITEFKTGISTTIDNAGEISMNKAFDTLKAAGHDVGIISDDVSFYNEIKNPDGSYKSPEGAPYVKHTSQIQDIGNELLKNGELPITDYQTLRNNNATMNKGNPAVTQFLNDAQAFNVTPTAKELGHVADEAGVITDTKTGVKYNVSEVFKNLLTNQGGGTGTITDLANYLKTDATTLEHAIVNGAAKALAAIGVAAMIADIAYTSITARGQLDSGDVAGAQQSVATLAARTGLGVAGAQAGYSLGLSIPANDNYIINNYRLTA